MASAKDLAAAALEQLAECRANAAANPVEPNNFKGSHNCLQNMERDHQRRTNGLWFAPDTVRCFGTRYPRGFLDIPGARVTLFITTERPPHGPRAASVRAYLWDNARVATLGDFCALSLAKADAVVDLLWKALR